MPKQSRSTATVDAILQASTYILVRHGWEGFNTNRVAERAGVNIASLYQYFPSKEAIVVELQRRHIAKAREAFPRAAPALRSQPSLKAMLELVVQAALDEHQVAPDLHRVFAEEIPRSARRAFEAADAAGLLEAGAARAARADERGRGAARAVPEAAEPQVGDLRRRPPFDTVSLRVGLLFGEDSD